MYLTLSEYVQMSPSSSEINNFSELSQRAEDNINVLTFDRITKIGFDNLTDFQKSIVKRAAFMQIKFLNDRAELIDTPLTNYSIGSVSMSFDKSGLVCLGGVTTTREVYGILLRSGLCYGGII